ncbi:indolepyruvate oxidoreductase subunit beta family protein [Rhodopila sp.]|uniref:indolepyruvate oxidoreductase subunit beta family protein n=1 Tax=Rhodopila sp. TaxID=2480087 RepID=UPI003D0E988A
MDRPITIAVLAIGGQGGGVLVDWIVALAEHKGWRAQSTSVPGVAQRTGATIYYVEVLEAAPDRTPVFSAMATPGDVDIVIAAEWMEAGRAIHRGLVTPDRTTLIASTHRAFAVSEKQVPGDGMADAAAVTAAARAAARRFVGFDMATLAEQAGSVVSSVLFGALCGAATLPFERAAFEAAISATGVGVQGSLRGFALGFDAVGAPPSVAAPSAGSDPVKPLLAPVGHPPFDGLLARAASLPAAAHEMLAEGLRHVVAFQDTAYGAAYLDAVEAIAGAARARVSGGVSTADGSHLYETAAKYIARAMVYDDVIRVAALKTQPSRADRVQREMGGRVIAITEFMHPRMEELLGLLPPALGTALERQPRVVAALGRLLCGPRRIRTDTILGFFMLYAVAGLRGWRRRTQRHAREWARIDAWLAQAREVAAEDPALAAEVLANQRLIKGYSDTHSRGLDKYAQVMAAAGRLQGRPDAAVWVRRLRQAALEDESGHALRQALRTVDSFLEQRQAA